MEHLYHRLFQYIADDWKSSYVPGSVPYREESYPDKERTKTDWPMAHDKNWWLAASRRTPLIGDGPVRPSLAVTSKQSRENVITAVRRSRRMIQTHWEPLGCGCLVYAIRSSQRGCICFLNILGIDNGPSMYR